MKFVLINMGLLLFISFGYAQDTYTFRYRIDANEEYKNAQNLYDTWEAKMGISIVRNLYYSNIFYNCVANKKYLINTWDFGKLKTELHKTYDTTKVKNYNFNIGGSIARSSIKFGNIPQIILCYDKLANTCYTMVNDTAKLNSVHRVKKYNFDATNTIDTINRFICRKWVLLDNDAYGDVSIWVSKDIPKEINPGIFYPQFNGGIVKIEWGNGRYDILENFSKVDTPYVFKILKLPLDKDNPDENYDLLIGALDAHDSMNVIYKHPDKE